LFNGLILCLFGSYVDLLVGALFVYFVDVARSLMEQVFPDILHISSLRPLFYLNGNFWVLLEYLVLQELLVQGDAFYVCEGCIDKLRLLVPAYVIVANI